MVKSTQFEQNWVLFFREWYTDGWVIVRKIGIEKVKFLRPGRHIHVQFWRKYPLRGYILHNSTCSVTVMKSSCGSWFIFIYPQVLSGHFQIHIFYTRVSVLF